MLVRLQGLSLPGAQARRCRSDTCLSFAPRLEALRLQALKLSSSQALRLWGSGANQAFPSLRCFGASKTRVVECAVPSPLAGHAVNPSVEARWRHPCRHTVPQPARAPHQDVGRWPREKLSVGDVHWTLNRRISSEQSETRIAPDHAHRPSRRVLARSPSRDLTRHGCRVRAYRDVLAACPARVSGQGPCSKTTHHPALKLIYPQSRRSSTVPYSMSAMMGGQRPCSQAVDQSLYDARTASGIMSR